MTHNSSVNFKVILFLFWTKGSHQSSNFDIFKCSSENLPNFSNLFSNHKSVFLQNFHISSESWKITPLYFFSSNNIYFAQKEPIKVKIFETFECSGQNLSNSFCQFWSDKSILSKFCIALQFHERWLLYTVLAQTIYILLKRIPLKWKSLRLSSARVKICQISHDNLKWQVNSSSNFASFFMVMTHNSSVDFKLILFLLWIKGPRQNPYLETFKYSSENLPYCSCHFPNHKSVFL